MAFKCCIQRKNALVRSIHSCENSQISRQFDLFAYITVDFSCNIVICYSVAAFSVTSAVEQLENVTENSRSVASVYFLNY